MALTKLTDIRKSLSVEVEDLKVNGITTFTGSVSIGGTLTYEDVTNIDSVGIITARSTIDAQGDVSIADKIIHTGDTNTAIRFPAADTISFETAGSERLNIASNGDVTITNTSSNPQLALISANNGISEIQFGDGADSVRGNIVYRSGSAGDALCFNGYNNTERLRITSTGRVGIGSAIPEKQLTIRIGSGDDGGILIKPNVSYANNQNRAYLIVGTQNWTGATTNWNTYGFQHRIKSTAGGVPRITIDGASGEFFCVTNGGNIGIGTNDPSSQLEVNAASAPHITSVLGGTDHITMTTGTTGGGFNVTTGNNFAINHQPFANRGGNSNITERLSISSNGDMRLGLNSVALATDSAHYIMTLTGKSGQTGAGGIAFKDPSANTDGFIFADSGNLFITADYDNATADSSIRFRVDGSSEKLRITSNGEVLKPSNPMFKAMRTSNQSVSSNGWVTIQFNSDSATGCFDVGGNFNTSNHRFTAPVTGYYQFGLNMRIDGGNADYFRVAFSLDGDVGASNNYPYGHAIYKDLDGFSYYSFSITALNYLTAGQYVRAEAYSSSDSTWYLQDESIFYGYLVG